MPDSWKKLQKIYKRLSTHQLRRLPEKEIGLKHDELFIRGSERSCSPFFLGYYSSAGLEYALKEYGLFKALQDRGYEDLKLTVDTRDPYKQRLAIFHEKKHPDNLLGEVVLKRKQLSIYTPFPSIILGRNYEFIAVEWLCMQDLKGLFSEKKPRLPGQKFPGLGMGKLVMELLMIMCWRLRTAGLLNVPEYFHNAQMYSSHFRYINPLFEAKRLAIERDLLSKYPLAVISWAIDLKCVEENQNLFEWFVDTQVIPLDRDLIEYFNSLDFKKLVENNKERFSYSLDESKWKHARKSIKNYLTC